MRQNKGVQKFIGSIVFKAVVDAQPLVFRIQIPMFWIKLTILVRKPFHLFKTLRHPTTSHFTAEKSWHTNQDTPACAVSKDSLVDSGSAC